MSIFTSAFAATLLLSVLMLNSNNTGCLANGNALSDKSFTISSNESGSGNQPYFHRGSGRLDAETGAA
jgi:hypothetical protein